MGEGEEANMRCSTGSKAAGTSVISSDNFSNQNKLHLAMVTCLISCSSVRYPTEDCATDRISGDNPVECCIAKLTRVASRLGEHR